MSSENLLKVKSYRRVVFSLGNFQAMSALQTLLCERKRNYSPFLTNFGDIYLTQFLTDLGQILDSKSYDQA